MVMTRIALVGLAALACGGALLFLLTRGGGRVVPLDVEFKLTDSEYGPLPNVPVRLVLGATDWQTPDAGVRVVTAADGSARFTTQARIGRRWSSSAIGFTALSVPFRADYLALAAELTYALPRQDGDDVIHRWLYTAEIDRMPDGDCSSLDLDEVYEAGPDGRFTKYIGSNASGPNFNTRVDGWILSSAGYQLSDFMLRRGDGEPGNERWRLRLGIKRMPKPVLP
jgi:hypothetical protein